MSTETTETTDMRGAKGGVILPAGDALGIVYTFTNPDASAYTDLSGTLSLFLKAGSQTITLDLDDSEQAGGIVSGSLTGTQSAQLAQGRTYSLILAADQGQPNRKTWAVTRITITGQGEGNSGNTQSSTQSVVVVDGVASQPVTVISGAMGPQGATGPTGATGPERPVLNITEEDYSTTTVYLGGTWSDDSRWQITKSVAGTQTRATQANNSGVTSLADAWAGKAGLTYA